MQPEIWCHCCDLAAIPCPSHTAAQSSSGSKSLLLATQPSSLEFIKARSLGNIQWACQHTATKGAETLIS